MRSNSFKNNVTYKTIRKQYIYIYSGRLFANGPGDWGSILGRVIPKTQKMVPDTSLLNTHYYKVRIKGKCTNPEKGVVRSLHLGLVAKYIVCEI